MKNLTKLLLASAVIAAPACFAVESLTSHQKQEVKQLIGQYIKANPTVVMESLVRYREQEVAKQQKQSATAITANAKKLLNSTHSPVLGNPHGDVTIVEFLDYRCGHCREMESVTKSILAKDANVRLIVKQLPIFSGESTIAAQLALVSNMQGKFAAVHHSLLTTQIPLTKDSIGKIVKQSGVDMSLANKAVKATWVQDEIEGNMLLAKQIGLMGTPAFVVMNSNDVSKNELVPGAVSVEKLSNLIAKIRSVK